MKTLIVPDIHERITRLNQIAVEFFPEADRIVMLGDFFDTHEQHQAAHKICEWIVAHQGDERITWLWGNHDCHYAFTNGMFRCSGYDWQTQATIKSMLTREVWERFKIWTHVAGFLVSHAGFNKHTIGLVNPLIHEEALKKAFSGGFHKLWNPGMSVGGVGIGGPTWLRWGEAYAPDNIEAFDIPQIVGHTIGKEVRTLIHESGPITYNLDTNLNHVMWVEDGQARVVPL